MKDVIVDKTDMKVTGANNKVADIATDLGHKKDRTKEATYNNRDDC